MPQDSELEQEEILKILKNDLGHEDFKLEEFKEKPASDIPLGFLGDHCKVQVIVSVSGERQTLFYFLKRMPTKVPQHLEYAVEVKAFYKEIELYKTLFVDLKNGQADLQGSMTKWRPEYFYSRGSDVFVLEDVSLQGYYMYPERCLMDEDHMRPSLVAMAAMHAASIVFEVKFNQGKVKTMSPNKTEPFTKGQVTLGDMYSHLTFETEFSDKKGHLGHEFVEAGIRSQVEVSKLLTGSSVEEKIKIGEELPGVLRRVYQLVKPSDRFKNVFIHGDLWSNNLLYRKDKKGKVKDALIIDFQLARYAPPAHDVMMFLYLSQDNTFLLENEKEMLKFYYTALSKELQKNNLAVDNYLSWPNFIESCEYYRDLGIIMRLFYFQLTLAPPELTTKIMNNPEEYMQSMMVDRTDMVLESFNKDEMYRKRVAEALKEAIGKFILN
ncbi:hypothetical protein RUM43_010961 [Polyplax serrata]|uniref:CHK kinase-like domain-containing protein n=1 Tax=Polyplax serrata TaxID=468196 RepID=A0AAN8NSR7_POLSC